MMKKKEKRTQEELMQFLMSKKERNGKLSKIGEWLLDTGGKTGVYIREEDMRFVLR